MLKGISPLISPELLKVLMEMGHGDEIVLADANYPSASHAQRLIRADGLKIPALLEAILPLFPLDTYVEKPLTLMQVVPGDPVKTPIWDLYRKMIAPYAKSANPFEEIGRFSFYERSKQAYAIVATGEIAQYSNLILKKGVITGAG